MAKGREHAEQVTACHRADAEEQTSTVSCSGVGAPSTIFNTLFSFSLALILSVNIDEGEHHLLEQGTKGHTKTDRKIRTLFISSRNSHHFKVKT